MSADRVRITCGLGAWHDGHRDKVLAIAVREPDPLKADAPGWRFLTGPELHGDLAEMERRAGPIVDSTDPECSNCHGDSILANRLGNTHPHSENCRVIRPLCKCGWPGPTLAVSDLVSTFDTEAGRAKNGEECYIEIGALYPLDLGNRPQTQMSPPFPQFRFWHRQSPADQRIARMNGVTLSEITTPYADFSVMCDGREGTLSRAWHAGHGSTQVLAIKYATNTYTAFAKGLERLDGPPIIDAQTTRRLSHPSAGLGLKWHAGELRFRDGADGGSLAPRLLDPLEEPVFNSSSIVPPPHEVSAFGGALYDRKALPGTIRACNCGRDDMPEWRSALVNVRPFQLAIDAGIRVLSIEGFRELLRGTGDLIE